MIENKKLLSAVLLLTFFVFIWSAVQPHDYLTWLLEVVPAIIGFSLIFYFRKSFSISNFLLILICMHSMVLFIGGHYTYAEVPIGNWVKDFFHLSRNHYDRLGHFFQGFEPAFLAREIFIRRHVVKNKGWSYFLAISVCLAFSAFYELIEFATAVVLGSTSNAFLGTQGDIWDTQKDMLMALIGAISSILFFKWHDQSIDMKKHT